MPERRRIASERNAAGPGAKNEVARGERQLIRAEAGTEQAGAHGLSHAIACIGRCVAISCFPNSNTHTHAKMEQRGRGSTGEKMEDALTARRKWEQR